MQELMPPLLMALITMSGSSAGTISIRWVMEEIAFAFFSMSSPSIFGSLKLEINRLKGQDLDSSSLKRACFETFSQWTSQSSLVRMALAWSLIVLLLSRMRILGFGDSVMGFLFTGGRH